MAVTRHLKPIVVAASILAVSAHSGLAPAQTIETTVSSNAATVGDEAAIRHVLASYSDALNGGKTAAVLPLYAEDGVFMPPYSQSAVGKEAVEKAYDAVFGELKFHVKFTIAELVMMGPSWAYVRTNSAGTTEHHSTGKTTAEANQELFIFKKGEDGRWRIARYSFSPTNPPAS
ncbi:MAG TPA: SgcJ/EcaC family oxidoreductase [Dongiaceae bacterium]|jgi:uncharacterized protein (TIGR02246 family)|nr:SgcJ/EcaC family oxidoreductase [Dongiaceae bacterium]